MSQTVSDDTISDVKADGPLAEADGPSAEAAKPDILEQQQLGFKTRPLTCDAVSTMGEMEFCSRLNKWFTGNGQAFGAHKDAVQHAVLDRAKALHFCSCRRARLGLPLEEDEEAAAICAAACALSAKETDRQAKHDFDEADLDEADRQAKRKRLKLAPDETTHIGEVTRLWWSRLTSPE